MPRKSAYKTLTIGKLKKIIANLPSDMPIVLASDEEGNSYGVVLDEIFGGVTWMAPSLTAMVDEQDEKEMKTAVNAFVLFPN